MTYCLPDNVPRLRARSTVARAPGWEAGMLEGTLEDFPLHEVFRLLATTRKTGVLRVTSAAGGGGHVYFRQGAVYAVRSTLPVEPLARRLVRAGAITEAQLDRLSREGLSDEPLEEALVQRGLASVDELQVAREGRLEDSVLALLGLEQGAFDWVEGEMIAVGRVRALPVEALMRELARRREELRLLVPGITSGEAVPSLARRLPRGMSSVRMGSEEWAVLSLVDGRRSVDEIAAAEGLEQALVSKILYRMLTAGLVEVGRAPAEAPGEAEEAAPSDEGEPAGFRIAMLCTGNRFRSPLLEGFVRQFAADRVALELISVGTQNLGARRALGEAVELAAEWDLDLTRHRSRHLKPGSLERADLVIGFERDHVKAAVQRGGARPERTFTLLELVTLLESEPPPDEVDPVARAELRIARAHRARKVVHRSRLETEIVDPLGGPPAAYRNTAVRLRDLARRLVVGLFGRVPPPPPPAGATPGLAEHPAATPS